MWWWSTRSIRLTRALADFARMVELFDNQSVSFVAVTQQFNTTTSMGRLTLNVLLSFAQFEREVIGERIRDKVAASKRKGIWMGGTLPMGYDVRERKLVVNQDESRTLREIFERYLELGSVRELKNDLDQRGIVSAVKLSRKGNRRGGKTFSRGALYCLLSNRIYRGEIRHKQQSHLGQHEPIISGELWERVQAKLIGHAVRDGEGRKTAALRSPLAGKLFDANGEPLYVQGAVKGQRRYRYYVSKRLVRGESQEPEQRWWLAAAEIERAVSAGARTMLGDRAAIALVLEESGIDSSHLVPVLRSIQTLIERLQADGETASSTLGEIIERVDLMREGIRILLKLPIAAEDCSGTTRHLALVRLIPLQLKRRGLETRMVLAGEATPSRVELPLLKAVARARRWALELISGQVDSVDEIARREHLDKRSVRRLLRLGFLSPRIVEAIAEGHQPPDLTVFSLIRRVDLPLLWNAQEQALGLH